MHLVKYNFITDIALEKYFVYNNSLDITIIIVQSQKTFVPNHYPVFSVVNTETKILGKLKTYKTFRLHCKQNI